MQLTPVFCDGTAGNRYTIFFQSALDGAVAKRVRGVFFTYERGNTKPNRLTGGGVITGLPAAKVTQGEYARPTLQVFSLQRSGNGGGMETQMTR